jgi:hypothetical protein
VFNSSSIKIWFCIEYWVDLSQQKRNSLNKAFNKKYSNQFGNDINRAPLNEIMDNGINQFMGSNLSRMTSPKLLFSVDGHWLIIIRRLLESVCLCPLVIPLILTFIIIVCYNQTFNSIPKQQQSVYAIIRSNLPCTNKKKDSSKSLYF